MQNRLKIKIKKHKMNYELARDFKSVFELNKCFFPFVYVFASVCGCVSTETPSSPAQLAPFAFYT